MVSNKILYKGEIFKTKYLPILLALLYLGNTTCSYFYYEICEFSIFGAVSFIILLGLYWDSYTYKLCSHHRMFLHYITIQNILNYIDYKIDGLPVSDRGNLLLDIILFGIFIILYIIFKRKYDFSRKHSSIVS